MAENKKSFVLYSDLIHTVDKMPNEKAGELFKHILEYVNDLNPETQDLIIQLTFEPIKQQLKRDLKRWESKQKQRSEAGKRSAEVRKAKVNEVEQKATTVESRSTKSTVSVNVNDTVNVNDNVIKKEKTKVFNFKSSLIELEIEEQIAIDWLKVRKDKKASNTETAFKAIIKEINKSNLSANDCIKTAVEKSWSGLKAEWLITESETTTKKPRINDKWEKKRLEQ